MPCLRNQTVFVKAAIKAIKKPQIICDVAINKAICKECIEVIKSDSIEGDHDEFYGLTAFRACEGFIDTHFKGWLLFQSGEEVFWAEYKINSNGLLDTHFAGGQVDKTFAANDTNLIAYF